MSDFDVVVDHINKIITIQGIRYSFDVFNLMAFGVKGSRYEIGERQDGVVVLQALPSAEGSLS